MRVMINKVKVGYIVSQESTQHFGQTEYAFNTLKEATAYLPKLFEPKEVKPAKVRKASIDKH